MSYAFPRWGMGAACALVLGALLAPRSQAVVLDPQGDWYSTTAATHRADLDVKSADGIYEDNTGWHLTATMWGNIDLTQPGQYVWGFGRGSGAAVAPFPGEPNVVFDSILSINPGAGTAVVRQSDVNVTNNLAASQWSVNGDTISAFIPKDFLPTVAGGFDDDAFTWNLWPRLPGGPVTNISDFAPENAMEPFRTVPAGAIPEPGSLLLLLSAAPATGLALLRRRRMA